jgi:HNH endonuclease
MRQGIRKALAAKGGHLTSMLMLKNSMASLEMTSLKMTSVKTTTSLKTTNLPKDNNLFDMATGEKLCHGSVIAAHIFQLHWQECLSVFTSLTDINDVRNALLLYKPVEDAFDRARVCILTDAGSQTMQFCLLDKALQMTKLADRAITLWKAAKLDIPQTPLRGGSFSSLKDVANNHQNSY